MFDDEFVDSLEDDPFEAARAFCQRFALFTETNKNKDRGSFLSEPIFTNFLDAFGIAQALAEANMYPIDIPDVNGMNRETTLDRIISYIKEFREAVDHHYGATSIERTRTRLRQKFNKAFHYEFSSGDISKAQKLINEIRDLLNKSTLFEEDHRKRLLARLERLQSELHKKMSNLDTFWGLIGDAGVVIGKFGSDVKPLFDRIRELTMIVWATQARGEGLPSNSPPPLQLPSPDAMSEAPGSSIDV